MTAPDSRLEEIEAKLRGAESYSRPSIVLATTHIAYLLAELRKAQGAIARVEGLHYESIAYADDIAEGSDEEVPEDYERHYCNEDGEDWPCSTIRAAVADATGAADMKATSAQRIRFGILAARHAMERDRLTPWQIDYLEGCEASGWTIGDAQRAYDRETWAVLHRERERK